MPAPTLQELLAKHGSLANIPDDSLRQAGYERVVKIDDSANASSVRVQRIGVLQPQPPPVPKVVADGRVIPDKHWGYGPGWAGRG